MAKPSLRIVESRSGEVFIEEDEENESQVDRILREAGKLNEKTRKLTIKTEIKEEPEEAVAK